MSRRHRQANRRFHDRVAARYDAVYSGPRWDAYFALSWAGLKPWLPRDLDAAVVDLGCGTGDFGLRIARSGFAVTLSDLSPRMLEAARTKAVALKLGRVQFVQADMMDLGALPEEHFALAVAQGDPLGFAADPGRALREVRRVLAPGGVLVASVDQTFAALDHYAERQDLDGLERFLATGTTEWLARDPAERFPVHTFRAEGLVALLDRTGFEVLDLFGKTVLPLPAFALLLADHGARRRILRLERRLCRERSALGRAAHLQVAARRR